MTIYNHTIGKTNYEVEPQPDQSVRVTCRYPRQTGEATVTVSFTKDKITVQEDAPHTDIASDIRKIGEGFSITQVGNFVDVDGAPSTIDDTFQHRSLRDFENGNGRLLSAIRPAVEAMVGVAVAAPLTALQQQMIRELNTTYEKRVAAVS